MFRFMGLDEKQLAEAVQLYYEKGHAMITRDKASRLAKNISNATMPEHEKILALLVALELIEFKPEPAVPLQAGFTFNEVLTNIMRTAGDADEFVKMLEAKGYSIASQGLPVGLIIDYTEYPNWLQFIGQLNAQGFRVVKDHG